MRNFNGEVILRQLMMDIQLKAANYASGMVGPSKTQPDPDEMFQEIDNYIQSRGFDW
jgi:hypothetical protein